MNGGGYDWAEAFGNDYENLGRKHYFGRRTIFLGLEFGGTIVGGTRLLGVLGLGARNPHEILELGRWIGCS